MTAKHISNLTLILSLFLTLIGETHAARLAVATNGEDSDQCGSKNTPCRSISQTITNASSGDTIIVGPGIYGDLNRNNSLGDTGEEFGSDSTQAAITVDKPLRIISSDGARSTVIDGSQIYDYAVRITASSVVFGRPGKGFSIIGGDTAHVLIDGSQVVIRGNVINGQGESTGVQVGCASDSPANVDRGRLTDSVISACTDNGVELCDTATNWTLFRNDISLNLSNGLSLEGSGHTIRGNVFGGNQNRGILSSANSVTIRGNIINGNNSTGISATSEELQVRKNSIIGNGGIGMFTNEADIIERNNIFGNQTARFGNFKNCGLFPEVFEDVAETIRINNNYWGAPEGTSGVGANQICANVVFENKDPKSRRKALNVKVQKPRT